ncbi:hypothetical protein HK096_004511 [Nowakowskiella sp. JEL0078]|nr:hypothetical protein HK096_004511 [Nowakowskiella sp. JEL0078]
MISFVQEKVDILGKDFILEIYEIYRAISTRASSMYAWQFAKANHVAEKNGWAKFVSMQNYYNGLLSMLTRVRELAKKISERTKSNVAPSQVAIAWVLSKDVVTAPIVGISKLKYLEDAVASLMLKLMMKRSNTLKSLTNQSLKSREGEQIIPEKYGDDGK